jgi:hypothetical protein
VDPWVRILLQLEVERQTGFALDAHDELTAALTSGDDRRFWRATQMFLSSAANVSKLLWGITREAEIDRKELRELLRVSDDSPLRSRALRNHYEHFDDRIVKYARAHPEAGWVDEHIGDRNAFGHPILRCFEPENSASGSTTSRIR